MSSESEAIRTGRPLSQALSGVSPESLQLWKERIASTGGFCFERMTPSDIGKFAREALESLPQFVAEIESLRAQRKRVEIAASVWSRRYWIAGIIFACLFGWMVWPTLWHYEHAGNVLVRINRVTGQAESVFRGR